MENYNKWTHFGLTIDGSLRVKLYANGEEVASGQIQTGQYVLRPFDKFTLFGAREGEGKDDPTKPIKGHVDELRIFDRAIGAAQMRDNYRASVPTGTEGRQKTFRVRASPSQYPQKEQLAGRRRNGH